MYDADDDDDIFNSSAVLAKEEDYMWFSSNSIVCVGADEAERCSLTIYAYLQGTPTLALDECQETFRETEQHRLIYPTDWLSRQTHGGMQRRQEQAYHEILSNKLLWPENSY